MKLDYLAFGAHPDDVEIGMAGTLIRASKQGLVTGICDLTRAELSSNGTPTIRMEEAEAAASIMGIAVRENLSFPDRGITGSMEQLKAVVTIIRKYKPRVVFAPYWTDRHPDHEHTSKLVKEAVFTAGIHKFEDLEGHNPHKTEQILYYFINTTVEPTAVVDISSEYDRKEEALLAYRSQFMRVEGDHKTPLNEGFIEMIKARDTLFGHKAGVRYGEGFVKQGPHLIFP